MVTILMRSFFAESNSCGWVAAPPTRMASKVRRASIPSSESMALASCIGVRPVYERSPVAASSCAARAKLGMEKPSDRSRQSGSTPATSERTNTWMPAMWEAGMASSHWPVPPRARCVASALETKLAAVSCAPFGVPVDPEVATTSAMEESIGSPARMWLRSSCARVRSSAGMGRKVACPAMAASRSGRMAAGSRGSTGRGERKVTVS